MAITMWHGMGIPNGMVIPRGAHNSGTDGYDSEPPISVSVPNRRFFTVLNRRFFVVPACFTVFRWFFAVPV